MSSPAFKDIIRIVGRGRKLQRDLTTEEAATAMRLLLSDSDVSDAQIGAFLVTMRVKEETVEEIIGFVAGAREIMQPFPAVATSQLVDLALPYDGKAKTLQTGVIAALVLAAAGVPVVLHGADDIPAKVGVGPLNLLRALDYPVDLPPADVAQNILMSNFGVLNLAQIFPEWTRLTPIRHHFGLRTLMNTVEKLLNPANATQHINGFYHGSYLTRMALALPGTSRKWIIQGEEGSIDVRPGKKTRVYCTEGDQMVETVINANDYGLTNVVPLAAPNDPLVHATLLRSALAGEVGPIFDQIALTAGALLWMLDKADNIADGIERAREMLKNGKAQGILDKMVTKQSVVREDL